MIRQLLMYQVVLLIQLGSSDTIGGLTGAGSVDLNGITSSLSVSLPTEATFSGVISGSTSASRLRKAGEGTLILSGE